MSLQKITCNNGGQALLHTCSPCNTEKGRVRSVGLASEWEVLESLIKALNGKSEDDPVALFEAAITAGKIHFISETTGSTNGGEPEYGDGYGDESQRFLTNNYTLDFNDPSYADNAEFYEGVEKNHWFVFWRTENLLHFGRKPASVHASDPTEADLNSDVTWNVSTAWKDKGKCAIAPAEPLAKFFDGCWEEE